MPLVKSIIKKALQANTRNSYLMVVTISKHMLLLRMYKDAQSISQRSNGRKPVLISKLGGYMGLTKARAYWITFKLKLIQSVSRSLYDKIVDNGISIKDFGAVGDGVVDDTLAFTRAASVGVAVRLPEGKYRITSLPAGLKGMYGEGVLLSETTSAVVNVPDGFYMKDITIEHKSNLNFTLKGNNIKITDVTYKFVGEEFPEMRHNGAQFESCNNLQIRGLNMYGSGLRVLGESSLILSDFYIDIMRHGVSKTNINAGTDGIKLSRKVVYNISNGIICNPSRDGVDAYTSGKTSNIDNVIVLNFYYQGIDLKFVPRAWSGDIDDTHHELNISNIQFIGGGDGAFEGDSNTRFSSISIFNNDESNDYKTAPRNINISNVLMKDVFVGVTAASNIAGLTLIGCDNVNISGYNTGYLTGTQDVGQNYRGAFISRCTCVNVVNSTFSGKDYGWSQFNSDNVNLTNTSIGYVRGYQDTAQGLAFSGSNRDFKMSQGRLHGLTHVINSRETTNIALSSSSLSGVKIYGGQMRIDTFDGLSFHNIYFECTESSIDAFLSSTATPSKSLCWVGGAMMGGRSCFNMQALKAPKIIGVHFSNYTSTTVIRGTTDGQSVITLCTVEGSGTLPTATGKDIIKDNILVIS